MCKLTPRLPWILHCDVCVVGKAVMVDVNELDAIDVKAAKLKPQMRGVGVGVDSAPTKYSNCK